MHSLACMSVVVCVVRKPRPCNSYSRRRDRINSVLWRSYYKGGGGMCVFAFGKGFLHLCQQWQGPGGIGMTPLGGLLGGRWGWLHTVFAILAGRSRLVQPH